MLGDRVEDGQLPTLGVYALEGEREWQDLEVELGVE